MENKSQNCEIAEILKSMRKELREMGQYEELTFFDGSRRLVRKQQLVDPLEIIVFYQLSIIIILLFITLVHRRNKQNGN